MEFAVVAPVFFLLIFGMIEYGRMMMVQQMITNASREGARRAVVDGTSASDVRQTVKDYLQSGNISVEASEIQVNPSPSAANFGDPVTVSIQVPYDRVSWLPAPRFLAGKSMSASSVMRRESVD